jgi:hypothetical protein
MQRSQALPPARIAALSEAIGRTENVWSAAGLQGEVWSRRQVCANVFGLLLEIISPCHDELRACLSF